MMTFEALESWRSARRLTREIYVLTRQNELTKDFGLCSQIQRAGVSIMANIAEGFERQHIQEKLQFYNIAQGSCGEVRSLLYVIEDNYPLLSAEAIRLREKSAQSGKLLMGLTQSTQRRKLKSPSSGSHLPSPRA